MKNSIPFLMNLLILTSLYSQDLSFRLYSGYSIPISDIYNMKYNHGGMVLGGNIDIIFIKNIGLSLSINYSKWENQYGDQYSGFNSDYYKQTLKWLPITASFIYKTDNILRKTNIYILIGIGNYKTTINNLFYHNNTEYLDTTVENNLGLEFGFRFEVLIYNRFGIFIEPKYNMIFNNDHMFVNLLGGFVISDIFNNHDK